MVLSYGGSMVVMESGLIWICFKGRANKREQLRMTSKILAKIKILEFLLIKVKKTGKAAGLGRNCI